MIFKVLRLCIIKEKIYTDMVIKPIFGVLTFTLTDILSKQHKISFENTNVILKYIDIEKIDI